MKQDKRFRTPEISVIVMNWNGKHFLETCLKALRRQRLRDFEMIVVNDSASDSHTELYG